MVEHSKIEWCDHTFNPWIGCQKVSPGCDNCYAETRDNWLHGGKHWGPHGERHRTSEANWNKVLKWNREAGAAGIRRKVFCASLADVFDNQVPDEWRSDLWALIWHTKNLDWLLLTKRPENVNGYRPFYSGAPWPNVWLGVSVEDQKHADHRIPILLDTPAAVRFVSYEPALGPVDFCESLEVWWDYEHHAWVDCPALPSKIDWIIVGGESGPGARPFGLGWARYTIAQCKAAGVPVFVKQLGAKPLESASYGDIDADYFMTLTDKKGGNPAEWPADLRVREMPTGAGGDG